MNLRIEILKTTVHVSRLKLWRGTDLDENSFENCNLVADNIECPTVVTR